MKISAAERKQIENEMIFRRINERVGSDLDDLDAMHTDDGNAHLRHDDLILLQFKCECSDENCTVRIPLRLSKYREIHSDRSAFIVKKDHEVDKIEKVIHEEDGFNIVRKNNTTPEPGNVLNTTRVDNSHSKNR